MVLNIYSKNLVGILLPRAHIYNPVSVINGLSLLQMVPVKTESRAH